MKTLVTTLLLGSLSLTGMHSAFADDDREEKHGYHSEHHGEHGGKYCDKHGKGNRIERMKQHLGLTDDQVKKMQDLREKYQPQKQALREKMRDTRKQLRDVMHAEQLDQREVKILANKIGDLKAEKIMLHAKKRSEMNAILTPEQRQKMRDWKQKRHEHHHGDHN